MSDTITFYTNPMSRGRIARWMLEEVGEPYETVVLEYGTTMKAPEYLAINPMGKVPAIRHGETIVTEGAAICAYLADVFPDKGLAHRLGSPPRPLLPLAVLCGGTSRGRRYRQVAGPARDRGQEDDGGLRQLRRDHQCAGAGGVRQPYICGDQFTAADVYVGSQIGWG
jgi:glutathione S-transferase